MGPSVRVATADDAEAIARIYAPIVEHTVISFELEVPTVDEMRRRIVATLVRFPWLVSVDAHGAVDGYVYASRHRARAAYQWSVDVTAYVREGARGRGVGKRLYTRLFELPNAASIALHESVGFEPLGIYRDVGFKRGAWHDVGWWQRALQPPTSPQEPKPFGGA